MFRSFIVVAVLFCTWGPSFAFATRAPYLFDLLRKPRYKAYRAAWLAMLKPEENLQTWLIRVAEPGGGGVAGPSYWVTDGIRRFRHATVCRPHNCGPDHVWVVFTADGKKAWALHILPGDGGQKTRWYGNPDARTRALLLRLVDE